ncbi:Uncharacterised protein [Mycobacteroides abscessus subsp. abscessus]|nr:Uncharacterised protein [Mycobacteroides abscessus subsp. abscessus]
MPSPISRMTFLAPEFRMESAMSELRSSPALVAPPCSESLPLATGFNSGPAASLLPSPPHAAITVVAHTKAVTAMYRCRRIRILPISAVLLNSDMVVAICEQKLSRDRRRCGHPTTTRVTAPPQRLSGL